MFQVFGIDNIDATIHWSRYIPALAKKRDDFHIELIEQRTTKYSPHEAQCAIIGNNQVFIIDCNLCRQLVCCLLRFHSGYDYFYFVFRLTEMDLFFNLILLMGKILEMNS